MERRLDILEQRDFTAEQFLEVMQGEDDKHQILSLGLSTAPGKSGDTRPVIHRHKIFIAGVIGIVAGHVARIPEPFFDCFNVFSLRLPICQAPTPP